MSYNVNLQSVTGPEDHKVDKMDFFSEKYL